MGHERVGILPKSKKWRNIVNQISSFSESNSNISELAKSTIKGVRQRFDRLKYDEGINAAFKFLILLSVAGKSKEPKEFLSNFDIKFKGKITPLQIAKSLNEYVNNNGGGSKEYESFAKYSAYDAITEWYKLKKSDQLGLFQTDNSFQVWEKASDGSGFCELSRIFFSNLTERYLKYFLEREASASISNISDRNYFNSQLKKHIEDISQHAFETTKIAQSYSAGWFNKNTKSGIPSDRLIKNFLSYSLGKIKGELLREENK